MTFRSTLFVTLFLFTGLASLALVYAPPQDNNPPIIETPVIQPISPASGDTVTVLVNVTDDRSGVMNVTIVYTTDDWQSVNASITADYNATSNRATATMPSPSGGGHITFYLVAFDNNGNRGVNDNNGTYYAYDIPALSGVVTTTTIVYIGVLAAVAAAIGLVAYMIIKPKSFNNPPRKSLPSGNSENY